MYKTVIIEDDPVITLLNQRYVELDKRFSVVRTFQSARPALLWLRTNPVDLIILDVYMPQMSGIELLKQLRMMGVDSDVMMVTSANDAATIESSMRLGITDYLIKPFGYERFRKALDTFCNRREAIHDGTYTQDALDDALSHISSSVAAIQSFQSDTPPKGLQAKTLETIEKYLKNNPSGHTCDEIASHVGLSVVTVRHYVNYLVEKSIIISSMDYNTGGRPCIIYRYL